jgi:hypothetical protein
MGLRVHKFKDKLTRYIFGKTGVLLNIELNTRGRGRRATLNATDPIESIEVLYIHLPPIASNSNLWRKALEHRPAAGGSIPIPRDERPVLRTRIRAILREWGPSSRVWSDRGYLFSAAVFERENELYQMEQEPGTAGRLEASDLPPKQEYLNPSGPRTTASDGTDLGHVGLRLGTFADRLSQQGTRGPQWARERESHHITQYLLAEYFHNGKRTTVESDPNRKAFPLLSRAPDAYPGLTLAGGMPSTFTGSGTVQIASLELGRGGAMPAISLARTTHRAGGLHVTPKADDFEGTDVTTQAGAVNRKFTGFLPATYRAKEQDAVRDATKYSDWAQWRDQDRAGVTTAIYGAMQRTYRWMRDHMEGRLQTGLRTIEREYYNDLGQGVTRTNSSNYTISTGEMDRVYTAARRHSRQTMRAAGWTGQT